jgi:hypothetical protein
MQCDQANERMGEVRKTLAKSCERRGESSCLIAGECIARPEVSTGSATTPATAH